MGCGLVRCDPIPTADELASIYRSPQYYKLTTPGHIGYGDYYADELVYRPYFRAKLRTLARFRPPPGRLLEIGAALGYALDEARHAGWDAAGLERSPDAAAYARQAFGLAVREGGFEDVAADGAWDAVVAFQTIEHVTDVRAAIRSIRNALAPGGVTLLTTPDHGSLVRRAMRRYWPSYRPEHLVYFDGRTLRALLESEGLAVERIAGDGQLRVPLRRVVERVGHYYFRGRLTGCGWPDWPVPVWLGDMEVVARRPS